MEEGQARLGDRHSGICDHGLPCCPHNVTGVISSASPDVIVNGKGAARLNDSVTHDCPHCGTGYISSASKTVIANGRGVARKNDSVTYPGGGGTIITASSDVFAGD
jgi:uncharacterized Zn-binding protein involved in type VI secretion